MPIINYIEADGTEYSVDVAEGTSLRLLFKTIVLSTLCVNC